MHLLLSTFAGTRSALTLLELVVVLTILAALGGLLVPLAGGYREAATLSSAVDSISEVSKLVEVASMQGSFDYPDNLDSLIETPNNPFSKLPTAAEFRVLQLDTNQVNVLARSGIRHVFDMNPTPSASATFEATLPVVRTSLNGRPLTDSGSILRVSPAAVLRELKINSGSTAGVGNIFVAFGFGDRNSLVGTHVQEAPFHVPIVGSPNTVYSRFLVIFEIPGAGAVGGNVRFRGTVLMTRDGIRGQGTLAEEFYDVR